MNNVLIDSSRFCLIGKIKGLAVESKRARNRLLKSKSDKAVWSLQQRKRIVGIDVRHHLLAYAFLRGAEYISIEKKCREDNLPNVTTILDIVLLHIPNVPKQWEEQYKSKIEKWLLDK